MIGKGKQEKQGPHRPREGSASAAQQPQAYIAASPTLPGIFMAMPPDDTPAPTRPVYTIDSVVHNKHLPHTIKMTEE